jgi:hypothetical protein
MTRAVPACRPISNPSLPGYGTTLCALKLPLDRRARHHDRARHRAADHPYVPPGHRNAPHDETSITRKWWRRWEQSTGTGITLLRKGCIWGPGSRVGAYDPPPPRWAGSDLLVPITAWGNALRGLTRHRFS